MQRRCYFKATGNGQTPEGAVKFDRASERESDAAPTGCQRAGVKNGRQAQTSFSGKLPVNFAGLQNRCLKDGDVTTACILPGDENMQMMLALERSGIDVVLTGQGARSRTGHQPKRVGGHGTCTAGAHCRHASWPSRQTAGRLRRWKVPYNCYITWRTRRDLA